MRLFLILALVSGIGAAVIGIDFGSEYLKVGVVKLGHGAIDIVLNEQTSRKTHNYVGFRTDERYIGEDAFQLSPRFPSNMLTFVNHLVGVPYCEASLARLQENFKLPYKFLNNSERGTIDVQVGPDEIYTGEELMSMLLSYIKKISEQHAEQPITDAVVVIPAATTTRQRQAILDAAKLADLNILSLMDATTAVALQYGIQRRGFGENFNQTNVVIFDIGASKLEVGVFGFLPPPANSSKKLKTTEVFGTMRVLSIVSDNTVGGRHFDAILVQRFADEYAAASGNKVLEMNDIHGHKALIKLFRSAKKAKETLSANKDVQVPVEGIFDEKDFVTHLTRAELLEVTNHLLERTVAAVHEALARANLTADDINSIELMGGGTRIPAIQEKLLAVSKNIGKTLNTDEAAALGGAFNAARLSGAFRVKGFALSAESPNTFSFQLSPTVEVANPVPRLLFSHGRLPARKQVTIKRTENFNLTLLLHDEESRENIAPAPLVTFAFNGVSAAFQKLGALKENVHPDANGTVTLKFTLQESGLVTLDSATAKFVNLVNVTRNVTKKADDKNSTNSTGDGEDAEAATESTVEVVLKERIGTEPLTWKAINAPSPLPMSTDDFTSARAKLLRLQQRDEEKAALAEAKNSLEAYIFHLKYESDYFDDSKATVGEEEKQKVQAAVKEVEAWIEDEGYSASKTDLQAKLRSLRDTVQPNVDKRDAEPEVVQQEPPVDAPADAPADAKEEDEDDEL